MTSLLLWQPLSIVVMFYCLLHKTAIYQDVLLQRDPCIALTHLFKWQMAEEHIRKSVLTAAPLPTSTNRMLVFGIIPGSGVLQGTV